MLLFTQCWSSNPNSAFSYSHPIHQHLLVRPSNYIQRLTRSHHFHCENLCANYLFSAHGSQHFSRYAFTPRYSIFFTTDHFFKTKCVISKIFPVLFHCRQYNVVLFTMITLTADIFAAQRLHCTHYHMESYSSSLQIMQLTLFYR